MENFFLMLMQIFLPGGHTSPDVALRFVDIQNFAGFPGHGSVDLRKTFCYIFMYSSDYFDLLCLLAQLQTALLQFFPVLGNSRTFFN